jgi:hypothetical protein
VEAGRAEREAQNSQAERRDNGAQGEGTVHQLLHRSQELRSGFLGIFRSTVIITLISAAVSLSQ